MICSPKLVPVRPPVRPVSTVVKFSSSSDEDDDEGATMTAWSKLHKQAALHVSHGFERTDGIKRNSTADVGSADLLTFGLSRFNDEQSAPCWTYTIITALTVVKKQWYGGQMRPPGKDVGLILNYG